MVASDNKLIEEVEAIRASGILGDKGRLPELFDYLAAHSGSNEILSENLVAAEVFGKRDFVSSSDDAKVRVYIHRLRKKLDEYYATTSPQSKDCRLTLPRGQYRLVLEQTAGSNRVAKKSKLLLIVMIALLANMLMWVAFYWGNIEKSKAPSALTLLLEKNDRPITILVGDYYMFGQQDEKGTLSVLMRDFEVNSPVDRERLYPDSIDVGLTYLPPSAAYALSYIVPVVDRSGRNYQVLKVSAANSDVLKNSDVIYLGLISGMSFIESLVFENTRFMPGASYDEIIDLKTNDYYSSSEAQGLISGATYHDYGYFELKRPSSNNLVLVVAGTRDTGLRGISELLAKPDIEPQLQGLEKQDKFEMLVEIEGQQQTDINIRVIEAR